MDCRKNVRDLTEQERRDFLTAVRELKRSGEYDTFVKTHFETTWEEDEGEWVLKGFPDDAHGGPAFLPWHRKFIREFEKKLQEQVPGVTLPYWDWTEEDHRADGNGGSPEELLVFKGDDTDPTDGLLGGNGVLDGGGDRSEGPFEEGFQISPPYEWECAYYRASRNDRLERELMDVDELPRPVTVEAALSIGEFYQEGEFEEETRAQSFHNVLEGLQIPSTDDFPDDEPRPDTPRNLHNYMHGWVGGDMNPRTAPNDPIFFLVHSYVDKLWADWQERHPEADQFPPNSSSAQDGHKLGTDMPPWNIDPGDTIDYRSMGYVYNTSPPTVELVRPAGTPTTLEFNDVPERRETSRSAVFEVVGCETTITLEVEDVTDPFTVKPGMGSRKHTPDAETNRTEADVWLTYPGGDAGMSPSGTATIYCPETDQRWTIQLSANVIPEPTVGVALVLDESGSMASASGDGSRTRMEVLRDAGEVFLDLLPAGNSLGIATFHSDAARAFSTQSIGGPGDTARSNAETTIQNLSPTTVDPATDAGYTSIGDGVIEGRGLLDSASDVDERAMVVFTDGHENRPEYIADLEASPYDEQLFAVGLGTPSQIKPAALQQLTDAGGPHEGYVLVSGTLTTDDQFLLDKYFVQVLAGVTNTDVVVDPEGRLGPESQNGQGRKSIPFDVSGADLGLDAILLSPREKLFTLTLETPGGTILESGEITGPDEQFVQGERVQAFRLPLPFATEDGQVHAGRWIAHIDANEKVFDRYLAELEESNLEEYERVVASGGPYSLLVNARSNLDFDASIRQSDFEPGARLRIRTVLNESGLPLSEATVTAEHTRPDGSRRRLRFDPVEPEAFEAVLEDADAGHHSFRIRARGTTLDGDAFVRERVLTGATWVGGSQSLPSSGDQPPGVDPTSDLDDLLLCLIRQGALDEYFEANDIDESVVRECLGRVDEDTETSSNQVNLAVSELHVDAEADEYENLNDEYAEFENTGEEDVDLTGWTVEDDAGHVFVFPKGVTLAAGATVRLRSGTGSNTESDLYWGSNRPIWNNRDDTVSVYDAERNLIARRSY